MAGNNHLDRQQSPWQATITLFHCWQLAHIIITPRLSHRSMTRDAFACLTTHNIVGAHHHKVLVRLKFEIQISSVNISLVNKSR